MKKLLFYMTGILACLVFIIVLTSAQAGKDQDYRELTGDSLYQLPVSLDNFFPPKAEQPVYLFMMLDMNKPFAGIISDLFENDIENSRANFEKFKSRYLEISKLVPEWEGYYPAEPLDKLQSALKTGEQGKVMEAFQQVGNICSDCHNKFMPAVQQKYFWGNFRSIKVKDPLTNSEVSNKQLMQFMDVNFTGIVTDVEQGQFENAQRQFQGFRARFQAMEETCINCHDTERHYYVDDNVKKMIDKLGQVLNSTPVDAGAVNKLHMGIGMESCFKCHLVHIPAAFTQENLSK